MTNETESSGLIGWWVPRAVRSLEAMQRGKHPERGDVLAMRCRIRHANWLGEGEATYKGSGDLFDSELLTKLPDS